MNILPMTDNMDLTALSNCTDDQLPIIIEQIGQSFQNREQKLQWDQTNFKLSFKEAEQLCIVCQHLDLLSQETRLHIRKSYLHRNTFLELKLVGTTGSVDYAIPHFKGLKKGGECENDYEHCHSKEERLEQKTSFQTCDSIIPGALYRYLAHCAAKLFPNMGSLSVTKLTTPYRVVNNMIQSVHPIASKVVLIRGSTQIKLQKDRVAYSASFLDRYVFLQNQYFETFQHTLTELFPSNYMIQAVQLYTKQLKMIEVDRNIFQALRQARMERLWPRVQRVYQYQLDFTLKAHAFTSDPDGFINFPWFPTEINALIADFYKI